MDNFDILIENIVTQHGRTTAGSVYLFVVYVMEPAVV
jgi:hypothetical protein